MDSGGGLTEGKEMTSVNDRDCPFMSLPALCFSFQAVFSFVPSVSAMLQAE